MIRAIASLRAILGRNPDEQIDHSDPN